MILYGSNPQTLPKALTYLAICFGCGAFFLIFAYWQYKKGEIETRYSTIYKVETPIKFWITLGMLTFGAFCFFMEGITKFIHYKH